MTIRILILLFALFGFSGCGAGSDRKQKSTDAGQSRNEQPGREKDSAGKEQTDEPIKLTTETAEEFLLEYGEKTPYDKVMISTPHGDIVIKLFENTPIHRANFLYLTELEYFDMTEFYRVSPGFVCQAGNSDDLETQKRRVEIGKYTLAPEFRTDNFNRYGAVAMARQYKDNPDKRSSCFEFFINLGEQKTRGGLRQLENEYGMSFTEHQKEVYTTRGGNPHLDKDHTVFGEVISGMDVAEKINGAEVDRREWPKEVIPIKVKIIKE